MVVCMSDDELEELMNRRVLPAMFMAVVVFCLVLMGAALLDRAWLAAAVLAGGALGLVWLVASAACRPPDCDVITDHRRNSADTRVRLDRHTTTKKTSACCRNL
jgi:hypothetical protein